MKIALIGTYPPPYGGRSIHIQRLKERLKENGVVCIVYDSSSVDKEENNVVTIRSMRIWLLGQFLRSPENIIHCHDYNPKLLFTFSLLSVLKGKKIIFTFHSFRYKQKDMRLFHKLAIWLAKETSIYFIAVSHEIKKKLTSLGIECKKIDVIPSFIPPTVKEEEIAECPEEVWDFIDNHSPVISANAFKIAFYNNQDLYGIDMCIELCANLKQDYPKIGFVFCLPDIGNYEYFEKMKQRITEKGIENNFLFITEQYQLYPIIMRSDVFVRPTNTDGYGVSVAEAIYFKIPAVASDVCTRPKGTILFKNRSVDDLTIRIKEILNNYKWHKERLGTVKLNDNFKKIVRVYRKLKK